MTQSARKAALRTAMQEARTKTLWLLDQVPDAYLKARVHDFYSPVGWHFGHIGMTEEFWTLCQALGRPALDDSLSFLFANLPENPREERVHLPSREDIRAYLAETRRRTWTALDETDLDSPEPLIADGYAWEFALQHECQHQETIAELLQLIRKQLGPGATGIGEALPESAPETAMIAVPGGAFRMGSNDRHGYDNERCAHTVEVAPFWLDQTPVTAAQWGRFITDGGYRRRELWTAEGWAWREREQVICPEYWYPDGAGFGYYGAPGRRPIYPQEPVSSLSWFEADAYAHWIGKRLPTEAEWEFAARFDPATGESRRFPWGDEAPDETRACFGLNVWQPAPVGERLGGASAFGLLAMAGGVWEWTGTPFLPYPGFEAYPYDGYSKEHMDGAHYVCRGGSWASAATILRCSFRNWYVPTYRQGFLGVRCAR